MASTCILVRHWLPILTICPVNKLPDLIYVTVEYVDTFAELYAVRRKVKKIASLRVMFMENIAQKLLDELPQANSVTVRLAFNRHQVTITRN